MIGNIKEIFLPKTGWQEKQVLQDPGYVKGVETTCCMLQGCTKYAMSKESKEITRKPVGFMQSCCFVFVGILSTYK